MQFARFTRHALFAILAAATVSVSLTGCVPVVAGGAATGGLIAADRRTSGAYIEDQAIELKTEKQISDQLGNKIHVNVTSFNRNVLLTGEALDEPSKHKAEAIAKNVENVRSVTNELAIGLASTLTSRSNDSYLTTKIKTLLISENKVPANYIKVVTENGVVYLMGMVTRKEADIAVEIVRSADGIQKVVKVFEYID